VFDHERCVSGDTADGCSAGGYFPGADEAAQIAKGSGRQASHRLRLETAQAHVGKARAV
jgi:hypothetical protein